MSSELLNMSFSTIVGTTNSLFCNQGEPVSPFCGFEMKDWGLLRAPGRRRRLRRVHRRAILCRSCHFADCSWRSFSFSFSFFLSLSLYSSLFSSLTLFRCLFPAPFFWRAYFSYSFALSLSFCLTLPSLALPLFFIPVLFSRFPTFSLFLFFFLLSLRLFFLRGLFSHASTFCSPSFSFCLSDFLSDWSCCWGSWSCAHLQSSRSGSSHQNVLSRTHRPSFSRCQSCLPFKASNISSFLLLFLLVKKYSSKTVIYQVKPVKLLNTFLSTCFPLLARMKYVGTFPR